MNDRVTQTGNVSILDCALWRICKSSVMEALKLVFERRQVLPRFLAEMSFSRSVCKRAMSAELVQDAYCMVRNQSCKRYNWLSTINAIIRETSQNNFTASGAWEMNRKVVLKIKKKKKKKKNLIRTS